LPFSKKAIKRVHERARGVPRRINLLADRALLGAYSSSEAVVDPSIVDQAADEVFGESRTRSRMQDWTPWVVGTAIGLTLAAAGTAVWLALAR
jgi:general secretion pathway protein A